MTAAMSDDVISSLAGLAHVSPQWGTTAGKAIAEIERLRGVISDVTNERDELRAQLTPPAMTPEEEAESLEAENIKHEREQERSYDAGYNAGFDAASREYAGDK